VRYVDIVGSGGTFNFVARLDSLPKGENFIPVIFIENKVFLNMDHELASDLYVAINNLVTDISRQSATKFKEIQFDCDWTEKTKDIYFYFLRKYKDSGINTSATIRLHQVKYKEITGVPPVNKGVLMYYNMGIISADTNNSIYSPAIAKRYTSYLKNYPLVLDLALPVFSWGIHIRDGKVIGLLNKTNERNFINDTNFISVSNSIFKAKRSLFKSGYYYQENDKVKIESVSKEQLEEMADHLKNKFKQKPKEIIYYDLDSINLQRYDEKIFEEISSRFN
jgi:hypothetical protein